MIKKLLVTHHLIFPVFFLLGSFLAAEFYSLPAKALTPFPYYTRTMDYDGWTAATQSDINTTGIAGATVALPSSISAADTNPAGYAMEMGSVSAVYNQVAITDLRIQPDGQPINSYQWGAGISPPPWGFSITYYSPITEGATYASSTTGDALVTEVSVRELRFTAARVFFDSKLAIGLSAEIVAAIRTLGGYSYNGLAPSYRIGTLYRLPQHLIFGAGFAPELAIGPSNAPDSTELPGFNRTVWRPAEVDLGVGWVPNRFFKVGLQLSYVGSTPNTALLSNQAITTGAQETIIPRLGESYILASYKNFTSVLAAGTYYETSRISGQDNRLHGTLGFEANPYFLNFGIGLDISADYHNVILGVGIDIVRTARFFDIVPPDTTPAYNGFFPSATQVSADGLPDQMTVGEPRQAEPQSLGDVKKIIEEAPGNIADKLKGVPTTVEKEEKKEEATKKAGRRKRKKSAKKTSPPAATASPTPPPQPPPASN